MSEPACRILAASFPDETEAVRRLFREYAHWLQVDLCFQGFGEELAGLPGDYVPPRGGLWLAKAGKSLAGVIALRPLAEPGACEMKRLWVRPAYRGRRLGRDLIETVVAAARRAGHARLRLDTLPREAPAFDALVTAIHARGWPLRTYFHFGNWFETVAGLRYDDYLARRPSRLRNTIARKRRQLEKAHDVDFEICRSPAEVAAAVAGYEAIYAESWKPAEPFPAFTPGLARSAAANGALRLGICRLDGVPAAAQIWLTCGGRATIFKLTDAARHRRRSLGTVLTAEMMRHALEVDQVREVDFGRGDDAYKRDWLSQRRERWGILACNPRSFRGLAAAGRHLLLPALRDRLRRRPR